MDRIDDEQLEKKKKKKFDWSSVRCSEGDHEWDYWVVKKTLDERGKYVDQGRMLVRDRVDSNCECRNGDAASTASTGGSTASCLIS